MKRPSSYTTIGIAVGLFTATLIGLSVASYVRSRKSISKRATRISPPQYAAK
jgi:Na+/H+ antiporter NhaA